MYLVKLDGVTDANVLKNVYNNLDCFNLANKVFIIYKINFPVSPALSEVITHAFLIELNQLVDLSEEELEEVVLELIELNSNILVGPGSESTKDKFVELAREYGLNFLWYKPFDFNKEVDVKNLTYNEFQIIKEIFDEPVANVVFNRKSFLYRYTVTNDGLVIDINGEMVANLNDEPFVNIIYHRPKGVDDIIQEELKLYNFQSNFNVNWYEPWPLLFDEPNLYDKILEYKYRVFEAIKNIKPDEYPAINREVIKILNDNGYIQFNDIKDVLATSLKEVV